MSMYKGENKILNSISTVSEDNIRAIAKEEDKVVYTTDETVIGTWVDGKPLYRKVINLNCPTCSDNGVFADATTDVSSLNIDYIMFKYVNIYTSNDVIIPYNGFNPNESAKLGGQVWYYKINKVIYARHTRIDFNNCPITAVIEYTKTTD